MIIVSVIKRGLDKYNGLPVALKATFWFTICNFIQRGMSLITTPIFTRLMSTEEYGIFSTYTAWENVLFMIISLSLYKSTMNLYVKYDDYKYVLSSICGIEILLTGTGLVMGILFRKPIAVLLKIPMSLVCCLFVNFISQAAYQTWAIYKRYIYEYKMLIVTTLIMSIGSSFVSIAVVLLTNATAFSRAISICVVSVFVAISIYISVFKSNRVFYDKRIWMFAIGFCVPLLPHFLSEFVLQSSDKLMINYMCSASDVAIYSVAYSVGSIINLFGNSVSATFSPYLYQKMYAKEYDKLSIRANQVLLFIGVVMLGIMLFSREIVMLFGGNKYIDSSYVIIPICLGVFFNYLFSFFGQIQQYFERKTAIVIPSIFCAILNICLNYIFIGMYGYRAASYTTFVCYFLFCIINYYLYRKVCREEINGNHVYDSKRIALICLIVVLGGCLISILNCKPHIKYTVLLLLSTLLLYKRNALIKCLGKIYKG